MTLDPAWLASALHARLPLDGGGVSLRCIAWSGAAGYPAAPTGESALGVWACLSLERPRGASTSIVVFVNPPQRAQPVERGRAYLDGWVAVMRRMLDTAEPGVLEHVIPANLVRPEVLALARPSTASDFEKALLAPKRLGALLGDPLAAKRRLDQGRA